jgi:hypothetical protein
MNLDSSVQTRVVLFSGTLICLAGRLETRSSVTRSTRRSSLASSGPVNVQRTAAASDVGRRDA